LIAAMARHANAGVDVVVERDDVDRNPRPGAVSDARAQRSYIRKKFDLSQNPGRKPGILTSALANAHSERQMIFFFLLHFVATMIVWQHHMYFKFRQRAAVVPEGANLYWWKRLVPPVEFGTMHAMLLQLALIPMTMARHTIATLSATSLARFVPFQHTLRMHIHLGYVMVLVVFLSTVLFFVFFGQGCVDQRSGKEPLVNGKESFCDSMKSEIMLTGYGLFAAFGIMGVTSYLRDKMKYELFYAVREATRPTVRRDCFPYDRVVNAVP
jgi:hypothetical protein